MFKLLKIGPKTSKHLGNIARIPVITQNPKLTTIEKISDYIWSKAKRSQGRLFQCHGAVRNDMAAQPPHPELKAHIQKVIRVKLNENRFVFGTLIGYDHFMNLSLRNAQIEVPGKSPLMVESCILRGASVLSFEAVNVG
jgi:small nuclear ribonucleoprotein G